MNVYNCWYLGASGYCCRLTGNNWMFVPDLCQLHNRISKNVVLQDLIFKNNYDRNYETNSDIDVGPMSFIRNLISLFLPSDRSCTIGGRLLLAYS